jgi:parvulin-like peptidyl-prolyl isomerase
MLAQRARERGLANDPEVIARIRQAEDSILADRYFEREVMPKIVVPDLNKRALEIYKASPERFTIGEAYNVQQILIGLNGRTREGAAERAREAYQQAVTGSKDFTIYARIYSDDKDIAKNLGDLGYRAPGSFTGAAWEVISKLSIGEIGKPLETERGFHIFKLIDHRTARLRSFDEVKDKIIAGEAQRIIDAKKEEAVDAARTDKSNTVFMDNIRKLHVEVDMNSIPKVESNRP